MLFFTVFPSWPRRGIGASSWTFLFSNTASDAAFRPLWPLGVISIILDCQRKANNWFTTRFHVVVGLFRNRSRRCQNGVRDTRFVASRVLPFCSFYVLTSSVILITKQTLGNMKSIFHTMKKQNVANGDVIYACLLIHNYKFCSLTLTAWLSITYL